MNCRVCVCVCVVGKGIVYLLLFCCRKVYGMEQRELWCTQCKWKKACTRFGEAQQA